MSDNAKVYILIHRWGNMDSNSNGSAIVKVSFNIEDLKEEILVECLSLQDEQNLHYEIQQLFKEYE